MNMKYTGSCHCGAVTFRFDGDEITKGLRCNCSICIKKGSLWKN
ncbi:GFA family protein [Vibrio sp. RC27]